MVTDFAGQQDQPEPKVQFQQEMDGQARARCWETECIQM
jgi:hypothetical protein